MLCVAVTDKLWQGCSGRCSPMVTPKPKGMPLLETECTSGFKQLPVNHYGLGPCDTRCLLLSKRIRNKKRYKTYTILDA